MQMQLLGNGAMREALCDQMLDRFRTLKKLGPRPLRAALSLRPQVPKQGGGSRDPRPHQVNRFPRLAVPPEDLLGDFCQVAKHVEAVGSLQRFWSAGFGPTSPCSRAIAANEQNSWMLFEPAFQGGGLAIRKQVDWRARLSSDEDGASVLPATEGECITAQHLRRRSRWIRGATPHPQDGHARTGQTELSAASRCGFSSQGKAQFREGFLSAGGSPGRHVGQRSKPLGKDCTRASLVRTPEATNHDEQS